MKKKNVSKIYKRVLALMLALVMVLGALPATVSAEETPTPVEFDLAVLAKNAKSNSEQLPATGQDGGATWAFDTQNHWWHSKWSDRSGIASTSNPIWIQTGFDKVWTVTAVTYLPRQDGDGTMKGVIKNYTIATAKLDNPTATPSNADFTDVKSGTLDLNNTLFTINLDTPVEATHVRITVTETYQGWGAVDMGEGFVAAERINFLGYDPVEVDKTALKAAIEKAGEITDVTIYVDSTEKAFTDALAAALAVDADENATQNAVEKATAELTAAQEALAMPADNSALKALVEANKEKVAEEYTENTWEAFDEAMKAAEALLEVDVTEEELAEAAEVLQGAVDGLVKLFDDVLDPEQYYYDPVYWAAENGITNGVTPTLFKPDDPCTRGQIVTFIWRALGEPGTEVTETEFTDVDAGQFYYNSMLWAVGAGVVTGRTETTFAPDASCKRGEIVTMLWRAKGKPETTVTEHTFTDVEEGQYYYDPMLWAVENNITTGKTATTFAPDATITRAETVTFLSRVYAE